MRFKTLLVIPVLGLTTACATLFSPGPVPVAMNSDTAGAEVWINGNMRGKTPLTLELNNSQPVTVTFKMAGRQDQTVDIGTKVRGGFVVLDVLGGLVPVIIDAATGEWKTLDKKVVSVNMLPASSTTGGAK